jgi:hypothetical protein
VCIDELALAIQLRWCKQKVVQHQQTPNHCVGEADNFQPKHKLKWSRADIPVALDGCELIGIDNKISVPWAPPFLDDEGSLG